MDSGAPITYQVTRVTPDTQFPPGEQPVPGKSVGFSTSVGYTGTVFVPDAVFADANVVKRMIEDQVKLVAAAMAVTGTIQG